MNEQLYEFMQGLPQGIVLIGILVGIGLGAMLVVKHNVTILRLLGRINQWIQRKIAGSVGVHMRTLNKSFKRTAELNINSPVFKVYRYFDTILVNTGLHRDGVTVAGLLFFILVLDIITTLVITFVFKLGFLAVPCVVVFFFLYVIIFRYVALTRVEENEAHIMDAIDLLVSDVKSGIFNSIIKYKDSFHESIRPFFLECIDNVQNKGYSFAAAMDILADQLGYSFSDFAQKAVYYEEKREEGSEGIFGSIIKMNHQRRILRREGAIAFTALKQTMVICFIMIGLFGAYTIISDPFCAEFLTNSVGGRLMILADVLVIAWVINYITNIRAKSL